MTTPNSTAVVSDDGDDLTDVGPVCDRSELQFPGLQASGAVSVALRFSFADTGHRISIGAIGLVGTQGTVSSFDRGFDLPRLIASENFPNPFSETTTIRYDLRRSANVQIDVFDVQGRLVTTLEDRYAELGQHEIEWDGNDNSGQPVASGVYFYQMNVDGKSAARSMVRVR